MNIALLSPSENAYSETFIQVHKNRLLGNIFYYYGWGTPNHLENFGVLDNSRFSRILHIIKGKYRKNRFSLSQSALLKSLNKNKINVIFAEFGMAGENVVPLCRALDLPLIVHFHGYDASKIEVLEEYSYYEETFSYAKYIVVVSRKMYNDFLNFGCPGHKLVYNPYGPDEKFTEVKPKFSKLQFISIGRFVNKKAPYYLILSFLKVISKFPNAQLIMAGDGALLESCKNITRYYNMEKNVIFPGVVSPERYRKYLEESHALVQHSITTEDGNTEGTPVGIIEASAAGLPVISTRHAGIPDVIEHNKTGLLVEEHDVHGMAENMITVLENPGYAREMGKNGKVNIQENFSLKKHIDILNDLTRKASNLG